MEGIALVIDQTKGNIKDNVGQCYQRIVQKYHTTYIFISPKILVLIIECFEICLFFIKEQSFHVRYLLFSRKLSMQVFNLNMEVSLTLTLIVQAALELRYGTFFNSVEPTDLVLQPAPVANT